MKKLVAVAGGLLLALANTVTPAVAAPTQSGSLSCSISGRTTFSSSGAVDHVVFSWYKNSTTKLGSDVPDYSSPWWATTPTAAKTAKVVVTWQGQSNTTQYSATCR